MKTDKKIEKIIKRFDKKFVLDDKPNVEPIFIDAVGSVGPIRQFIRQTLIDYREEVRQEVLNEIRHERDKLLDGFGHPEDCKFCGCEHESDGEVYANSAKV